MALTFGARPCYRTTPGRAGKPGPNLPPRRRAATHRAPTNPVRHVGRPYIRPHSALENRSLDGVRLKRGRHSTAPKQDRFAPGARCAWDRSVIERSPRVMKDRLMRRLHLRAHAEPLGTRQELDLDPQLRDRPDPRAPPAPLGRRPP